MACEKEHNGHKIIYYGAILPEVKQLKEELEQCKAVIENRWKEYLRKKFDGDVE